MEMNSDFIAIQGILKSVVKTTGDFTKIKYKGGNEMKISNVIKELEDFLTAKNYMDKRLPNTQFYKQLDDITFFLVLNLDFTNKTIADIKEFVHLVNVIPTFSKCLLANIIVELGLNEYYCNALHKLPVEYAEELLSEIVPCIKKSKADNCLELITIYMKNIIKKVSSVDTSTNPNAVEYIEKLELISSEVLLNCSGINSDYTEGWRKITIYQHMGHTLLCQLKLLLHCQVDNESLFKIIDDLINSICVLMNAVTVDVFCAWAELEYKNGVLQNVIAEDCYHVLEKFQKYEPARPLIQMLGSIAKKPKSLNELILEANDTVMIMRIEQSATDRNRWFTALLNTQVFQNKEAKECVNRWANLCTMEDMDRLLSLAVNHRNEQDVTEIIIKCALFFTEIELSIIITRYFCQYGLKNCLRSRNTLSQLTITMNKLEKHVDKESTKDLLLLFLQDPEVVLTTLYIGCVKNAMLIESLEETFKHVSEIVVIEKLYLHSLLKVTEQYKFDSTNVKNYEKLLKAISKTNYKKVLNDFVIPLIKSYLGEERLEELNYVFCIYSELVNKTTPEDVDQLIQISISILEKCRWRIFDFTNIKPMICNEAVQALLDCKHYHYNDIADENIASSHQILNKYYLMYLKSRAELDFLDTVCPKLSVNKHAESVGYLIKVLPQCGTIEWNAVTRRLLIKCATPKDVIQMITDALLIITEVAQTQLEKNNCVLNGLKFCIQNYGLIIRDIILPLGEEEANIAIAKGICRLIREMPAKAVALEGLSLISLIPDQTLKGLRHDESFLAILISMKGSEPSRIIAMRMLETL